MISSYRKPPNSDRRRQKISNTKLIDKSNRVHDLERPQMTPKESSQKLKQLNLTHV